MTIVTYRIKNPDNYLLRLSGKWRSATFFDTLKLPEVYTLK